MNYFRQKAEALDSAWEKGGWAARVAIFLVVGATIWTTGLSWKYPQGFLSLVHFPRLEDFLKLCADPLARDLAEPIVAFRITIPLLSFSLGLGPGASVVLGWLALALGYAVCWVALRRRTGSGYALLVVFGLSQSFFAHASNRWLGIPDSATLLALAVCLLTTNPFGVAVATVLGMMNDERFLLAAPGLLAWHLVTGESAGRVPMTIKTCCSRLIPLVAGFGIGLLITALARYALAVGWIGSGIPRLHIYESMADMPRAASGWQPFASSWPIFFFNILFSWAWMWIYAGYLLFRALPRINRTAAALFALYFVAAVMSTALVIDVSRSMGFMFPVFLSGAAAFYLSSPRRATIVAATVAVLMAITPGIYYGTRGSGAVFIPYPVELANNAIAEVTGSNPLAVLKRVFSLKGAFGGVSPAEH